MSVYKCVVYDENKKKKNIEIDLGSGKSLIEYAREHNLSIVKVKDSRSKYKKEKVKDNDLKVICKQMAILIESGCEITKLLNILIEESNEKVSSIVSKIYYYIQIGNSVTEAFLSTGIFSSFFINMIKAGEVSGNLDTVFNNLSDYFEKESKLKVKMINILIYPMILTITSIVVTLFTIIFIVPNFQLIFENNGINPPFLTKILIDISIFIRKNFIYFILLLITFATYIIYFIKTSSKLRIIINRAVFNIPYICEITKIVIAARFSRSLYILINSGIQIVYALEISSNILDNDFVNERLSIGIEYIKRGNSIGESLSLANVFPSLFISMIKIGEESGKLDTSLNTINKYYENELDTKTQKFMSYIQPAIIMILGIIVGGMLISIVTPMFDMVNAI